MLKISAKQNVIGSQITSRIERNMARAHKSALSSTGWWIARELEEHIETGGRGTWPGLHPMTSWYRKRFRKSKEGPSSFTRRKMPRSVGPMSWLAKFGRYRVMPAQNMVEVSFGKAAGWRFGNLNRFIAAIVSRTEKGDTIRVTDKMRRMLATTRRKRPKDQKPGLMYFPLKKSTTTLKIKARPIFGPVTRRVATKVFPYFDKKYRDALTRYSSGEKKQFDNWKWIWK